MDLQTVTYLVVGASFALYIGIAIWARAGSTSEFYAAGGSVHPITNGMATAADWMSAASFISMAGLIATCRLHDIDPYAYLVDVLQRVGQHPAADVAQLTPRLWKQHFAANPLRPDLHPRSK